MAEWLGRGLQSLVRRFESGSRLFAVVVRDVAAPATFHVSPSAQPLMQHAVLLASMEAQKEV